MTGKKPIKDLIESCITKVEEHYKLKELYQRLNQGINVENVLKETVEDYKEKMEKYILEVLEEMEKYHAHRESLHGDQKKEAEEELCECEKDLYCTIAELFELYHFFRELENLSKEQINEAVSIPVEIIYNVVLKLKGIEEKNQ